MPINWGWIAFGLSWYFTGVAFLESRRRWNNASEPYDYLTVVGWPIVFWIELAKEVTK